MILKVSSTNPEFHLARRLTNSDLNNYIVLFLYQSVCVDALTVSPLAALISGALREISVQ